MNAIAVRARGLAAGYGGGPVLRDVEFSAAAGDRVGVLGPNGGGKTTLFRVLLGLLKPMAGDFEMPDRPASVPQTERSRLDYPVTALDVVVMGTIPGRPWWRHGGRAARRAALDALGEVGLAERARDSFGELSGGQRQRVLVARGLVQQSRLLLLDEPFTGLDAPATERLGGLLDRLAAAGHTVLVSTHDLRQALMWDLVLCLNRRQVAFGPPRETLTREVVEATYGGDIVDLPGRHAARSLLPAHHRAG